MQIPKVIHQIWFQGYNNIPPHLLEYHNSWITINPNYKVIVWDEHKIEELVNTTDDKWIKELYFSYTKMIQKIDFAKYLILYTFGGIYMDMDIKCLKSIDTTPAIETSDFIASYLVFDIKQHLGLSIVGAISFSDKIINNGVIMCAPKHEILLLTMKEAYTKRNFHSIFNTVEVFVKTGPCCLTNALKKYTVAHPTSRDKIQLLNYSYFEACDVIEVNQNKCKIPNNAIGIHYYENSWLTTNETKTINAYIFLTKYWYVLVAIIIIIIAFCFYFKKSAYKLHKSPKLRKVVR